MKSLFGRTTWLTAMAIFSMFFGAGNVVFPLALGQIAGDQIVPALGGLLLTAIGGPILGLMTATLFEGKCLPFFRRAGKGWGYAIMIVCMALLGPLAVLPRCVVVAQAALEPLTGLSLLPFTLLFAVVAWLCCFRRQHLLRILGIFLSPLLLGALALVIWRGLTTGSYLAPSHLSMTSAFCQGLWTGYDTMDLIASIFFSATIWNLLHTHLKTNAKLLKTTLVSGCLGGGLLGLIYIGLCVASAFHREALAGVAPESLMTHLAYLTLGPVLGGVANIAIALACLTTVVSLALALSDLIHRELAPGRFSHGGVLISMLGMTTVVANLGFGVIMALIHPAAFICYPAIIVLTVCNLFHKVGHFERVKVPVVGCLALTAVAYFI